MRTRYGVSPWVDVFPASRRPSYPRLRGEHTCDVVIIGGGLTGCAIAQACAAAGMRPMLVEADRIGQGSSGRGAGLLLPEPGPSFGEIAGAHGLRAARHIFETWRRASLDAAAALRRLGVKCALEKEQTLIVGGHVDEKTLRREFEARDAAGLDVRWLPAKPAATLTRIDVAGGIRTGDGFSLDPYRATVALAALAARRGAAIFEKSPVKKAKFGRNGVDVMLEGAVVRAATAIVATGVATAEFAPLRRHFTRRERYHVLTAPMAAAMRKQVGVAGLTFRDSLAPPHRIRVTADHRLLIAGADQDETPARTRHAVLVQRTGQLMYELLTMNPAISGLQPEYGWDLPIGQTIDGLPYIGPHRNYPHHLFALGGSGESVTGAFLAARILLRVLRVEAEKADALFGFTR